MASDHAAWGRVLSPEHLIDQSPAQPGPGCRLRPRSIRVVVAISGANGLGTVRRAHRPTGGQNRESGAGSKMKATSASRCHQYRRAPDTTCARSALAQAMGERGPRARG